MSYEVLDWVLVLASIAAYLGACGASVRRALARQDAESRTWKLLVVVGWLACAAFLMSAGIRRHACPLVNRMEAMAFVTTLLVLVCGLLDFSFRMTGLTAVSVPIATALLTGSLSLGGDGPAGRTEHGHWLYLHVAFMLLSYSAFAIAFLGGALFLYQERQLRTKRFGLLFHRLPPLDAADRLTARAILFGFPLLTLGILIGGVRAQTQGILNTVWFADPKVILSIFTWVLFLVVIALRLGMKYGGRRIAYLTVLGFGVLAFTVLGASLIGTGSHHW